MGQWRGGAGREVGNAEEGCFLGGTGWYLFEKGYPTSTTFVTVPIYSTYALRILVGKSSDAKSQLKLVFGLDTYFGIVNTREQYFCLIFSLLWNLPALVPSLEW